MQRSFDSFGRIDRQRRRFILPEAVQAAFTQGNSRDQSFLAYGNGRSYGDSCHNDAGFLVPMRVDAKILAFDPNTGILTADGGVLLSEIIDYVEPHGYFLPVTPGTRFVTLGGAIANDVHGKNHHRKGTFGCHVHGFDLMRSDGMVYYCSITQNGDLFRATIGGMGLTGLILGVRIQLMPVSGLDIEEKVVFFPHLDAYFEMAEAADRDNEYAVAWIDQLSQGHSQGRGLLITGNHANTSASASSSGGMKLSVPFELPFSVLNRASLSLFNAAYFHGKKRKHSPHVTSWQSFFYPLDSVGNWNRFYGPRGLYQHQSVIPFHCASTVIPTMLSASREAGQASFLTVLKRFTDMPSPGLMSFPVPGYTLTMDFPNRGARTLDLLERLDRMTVDAGGRVNPYKDQRMSAKTFAAGYPNWRNLEAFRDRAFNSNFWRRTALALDNRQQGISAKQYG